MKQQWTIKKICIFLGFYVGLDGNTSRSNSASVEADFLERERKIFVESSPP